MTTIGTINDPNAAKVQPPAGAVVLWPNVVPIPDGWLECDASDVSRSTYWVLFALIGENFGAGDGTTTFAVPDLGASAPPGGFAYIIKAF